MRIWGWRWVQLVLLPALGVVLNIFCNPAVIFIVADDVFVIVTLPDRCYIAPMHGMYPVGYRCLIRPDDCPQRPRHHVGTSVGAQGRVAGIMALEFLPCAPTTAIQYHNSMHMVRHDYV